MDMYVLGIVVGVAVVVVLAVVIFMLLCRKQPTGFSEKAYDERQQRARAVCFKAGFFTLLIYNALYGLSSVLLKAPWCDVPAGCFIGICVGATVFAVVSIMRDAYIPVRDTLRRNVILFAILAGVNALYALRYFLDPDESMIVDGMLTFRCMNLVIVIMFIIIFAAMLIKRGRDAREAEE